MSETPPSVLKSIADLKHQFLLLHHSLGAGNPDDAAEIVQGMVSKLDNLGQQVTALNTNVTNLATAVNAIPGVTPVPIVTPPATS